MNKIRVILTADTKLLPPSVHEATLEDAIKLLNSLTVVHLRQWDYPNYHVLMAQYDSMMVGAAATFYTPKPWVKYLERNNVADNV